MYQLRFSCAGTVRKAAPIAGPGGTAIVTTLRHRSGALTAAPMVPGAPQSWPMITPGSPPPRASWNPFASSASAAVW